MARKVECAKCNYPEIVFGRRLWVISFVLKFPIFVAMATGGRSDVNFNDTSKLLDLENPPLGAISMALCLIFAELWLILS